MLVSKIRYLWTLSIFLLILSIPIGNGQWNQFRADEKNLGLCRLSGKGTLDSYSFSDSFNTNGLLYANPVVGDIDNDGENEIIIASEDSNIYALTSKCSLIWKYHAGGAIDSTPLVIDITADGKLEIIFGCNNGYLYCLNSEGDLLWNFQTGDSILSSPTAADITGDDYLDIVFGSYDNFIYAINRNGVEIWSYETNDAIASSPGVADLDNDGLPEVVIGSDDGNLYAIKTNTLPLTGIFIAEELWHFETSGSVISTPSLYDIDKDSQIEIIFSSLDERLYVLENDGEEKWNVDLSPASNIVNCIVWDINNDKKIEIITGTERFTVAFDSEGTILWKFANESSYGYQTSLIGVDFNGDLYYEILCNDRSNSSTQLVLNYRGQIIHEFYTANYDNPVQPSAMDIDNDGIIEILNNGHHGLFYIIDIRDVDNAIPDHDNEDSISGFNSSIVIISVMVILLLIVYYRRV